MGKTIHRCATTSFSPLSQLIACGTVAGAMDDSFSTTASLEVFSVDHSKSNFSGESGGDSSSMRDECEVVGTGVSVTERFHRLCWGNQRSEGLPHGILAGGLADGTVQLYDPNAMIRSSSSSSKAKRNSNNNNNNNDGGDSFFGAHHEDLPAAGTVSGCVLTTLQNAHAGAVRGLDFNPFSSNLLASGGRDGELSIWDINDPTKPSKYPALVSGPSGPHTGEIAQIQWNTKVSHILASCGTTSGTTVVWDLKRQRPVISFVDPQSKRRCSAISWNPDVATQLIVASDDDRSCSLQVWDLRNSVAPTNEFVGHTKGVLSLAWSPHDGDLLLSSGKDNRTLVWDAKDGSVLAEFPASSNWNFDAQWSKKTAGEISAASFDGTISIHNLNDCGKQSAHQQQYQQYGQNGMQQHQQQQQPREPMRKAPKWMKRPAGASFGFGGKLVSFGADVPGVVKITTVDVSDEHESRSGGARGGDSLAGSSEGGDGAEENDIDAEFQAAIKSNDEQQLKALCDARAQSKDPSISSEDKETWAFMSILFSDDARRRMLEHLNFSDALKNLERSKQMRLTEAALENASLNDDAAGTSSSGLDERSQMVAPPPPVEDENAFFDGLGEDGKNQSGLASPRKSTMPAPLSPSQKTKQEKPVPVLKREPADREIERCLIVGDYDGAVEACEKAGRFADALVLASSAGPELWQRAQKRHLERSPRRYLQFAESIASANLEKLVESEPITNWRETLAILCTYSDAKAWDDLSLKLADKLQASNMAHEASLCRVCAGDVDNAVKHWSMRARGSATSSKFTSKKAQWQLLEKAIVLSRAANLSQATPGFARLLSARAESLASSGKLKSALALLDMAPGAGISGREDADIALLRERIDRASSESKAASSSSAGGYHQQPRSNGYSSQPAPMQPSSYGVGGGAPPMNPMMNTSFAAPPPPPVQQQQPFQPPPSYSAAPPPPPTQFTPPPAPAQMSAPAMPPPPTNPDTSFYSAPPPAPASGHLAPQGSANTSFYAPPSVPGAPGGSMNSYDPYGGGGRRESEVPKPPPVTSFAPSEMEYDDAPVQSAYSTGSSAPQQGGMNQSFQQMTPPAPGGGQQSMMPPPPPKQVTPPPSYSAGPPPPMQQQQQSFAPPPPPMASQPPPMQQQTQVPPPIAQPPAAPPPSFDPSPVNDAPPAPIVSPRGRGGPMGGPPPAGGPPPPVAAPPPPSYSPAAAPPPAYSPAPAAAPPPMQQQQQSQQSFQQAAPPPQQQFQQQAPPMQQQQQQQPPQHHQAPPPPQQQQPPSPRRPAGPPADVTLATVQSSNCSPSGAQISQCVKKMHDECFQQLASNPVRKKELEDCSKRLGQLCWRLNEKQVSAAVEEKLMKLCEAASRGDWATANSVHVEMTTQHWDECSGFLTALKRLLKTRSTL